MAAGAQPPDPDPARPVPVLRCNLCARTTECTADQITDAPNGWPCCCGQAMELFIQTPPDVDGGRDADSFKHNPGGHRA